MSGIPKKFVVDIWSDYVCPWCWVAKRRFEKALESFPQKDSVQVNVRALIFFAKFNFYEVK